MGAPRAMALCLNFGGALDFQEGQWGSAEENLRGAVKLYRQVGSASGESLSLQRLGVLLTAKGVLDEGQRCLDDGLVVAERAAMRSHCLTRLHASMIRNRLAARDRAGLVISLAEAEEVARRHGKCVTCSALVLPEMVRAHIALGNVEQAEACLEGLRGISGEFESQVWTAMAAAAEGRVAFAQGRLDDAGRQFLPAQKAFEASGQPYEAARCLAFRAQCAESSEEGKALAFAAKAKFAELGASGDEDAPPFPAE